MLRRAEPWLRCDGMDDPMLTGIDSDEVSSANPVHASACA